VARSVVAGRHIGVRHGEAFALLAPVGLVNFDPLVPPER
jgi:hypothetical protein